MNATSPKNPFIVGKYLSEAYFCDRFLSEWLATVY